METQTYLIDIVYVLCEIQLMSLDRFAPNQILYVSTCLSSVSKQSLLIDCELFMALLCTLALTS